MRRVFGQVGRLKPEMIDEYRRLHREAVHGPQWAGVLETIRRCHLEDYAIFLLGDVVFSYFVYTGDDYEADMAAMAADPVTQAWWTHTHPCFAQYDPRWPEPFYVDMEQIFRMD